MKYIALLRGINVGGRNILRMEALRLLFTELGCTDLQTYIQSGNVIFSAVKPSITSLEKGITASIKSQYGYNVQTVIVSVEEFRQIHDANPYLQSAGIDLKALHITVLSAIPSSEDLTKLPPVDYSPESYTILGRAVYLYCPNGVAQSKLSNTVWEKHLHVHATSRNLNTIHRLLTLATQ